MKYLKIPKNPIIIDNEPLQGDEYIPEEILFRGDEIKDIAATVFIKPFKKTPQKPQPLFIFGDPSTGKTLAVRLLMRELAEEGKEDVIAFYINARDTPTLNTFGIKIIDTYEQQTGNFRQIPAKYKKKGLGAVEYIKKFLTELEGKYKHVILIIDEVERLAPTQFDKVDNILYTLVRAGTPEVGLLKKTKLGLVIISNDRDFRDKLSGGTRSSFGVSRIDFKRYTPDQIKAIIKQRCEKALRKDAWDMAVIQTLIREVYDPIGLREVFSALEIAADKAEAAGEKKITPDFLKKAIKSTYDEHGEAFLAQYDLTHKIIMLLAYGKEYLFFKHFYKGYTEVCRTYGIDNLGEKAIRKVLKNLERDGLLKYDLKERGAKRYRAGLGLLENKEPLLKLIKEDIGREAKITDMEKDLRRRIHDTLPKKGPTDSTLNGIMAPKEEK